MSLVSELKRRGVFRIVLAYLATAWLLLQIADLVLPAYGFSDQAMATLINIIALGVVPAAILAWIFEWTPEGITRDTGAATPPARARVIDRGIIVVLLLAVSYFAVDKFVFSPAAEIELDNSIAVLPFVNMSSDPEQDYFSDGISEEILNLLSKVQDLRVISRSSAFAYRGQNINIPEVGEALKVAYVLEGSVRKAGNRIRITAQLIEAATDKHLWSETFDRDLVDVFAIQDEVSARIIDQLKVELTGEAPHAHRTDPETYAMYLRGKAQVMQSGLMGDPEAVRIMEQVVERDPNYVPGLVYLATVIGYERRNHGEASPYWGEKGDRRIEELVTRALEIDPDYAPALSSLAWHVYRTTRDVPRVLALLERALESDANDGETLRAAAAFALYIGDFEARPRIVKRAAERDPACLHCISDYSGALLDAGRLDEAEAVARTRMALAPGGEVELGKVHMARGQYDDAFETFGKITFKDERLINQAWALFKADDMAGYERIKNELKEELDNPWYMAILHAMEGEKDIALQYLAEAFAESTVMFGFVLRDPMFANLDGEPIWEELRERAGLTEAQIAGARFDLPDGF